jgi:hypothetical protein
MLLAADASANAPWWGVPTIAGAFLIIGGCLAFLSTARSDRRRARYELDQAHRAEAFELRKSVNTASATLLVESRNFYEAYKANFVVGDHGAVDSVSPPVPLDFSATHLAYWQLTFVSPVELRQLARELHEATRAFNRISVSDRRVRPFATGAWVPARNRYYAARTALVTHLTAGIDGTYAQAD